jgi:hypothetical protein
MRIELMHNWSSFERSIFTSAAVATLVSPTNYLTA